ncbi:MAG: WYL domain-containing protein [Lachnospiraceae bacterium]|nr:WYL domain-containing protein [Lachnospiraceae bacterium]
MRTDRLIGILAAIQQKGKVTAPYLAERFEVSRRTIMRDIEALCCAGFPIVTEPGGGGGISLMPGFSLDAGRLALSAEELSAVAAGLRSLESVGITVRGGTFTEAGLKDSAFRIDLSSFYRSSLTEKIALLRRAVARHRRVKFRYYYEKGEEEKELAPYFICFQWSGWYVFGYSSERRDYRMYKLARLWQLEITEKTFLPRDIPEEKLQFGTNMTDDIIITAVYEPQEKFRLVEEYGPDSFTVREDGKLLTEWGFSSYERALRWLMPFGHSVQIIAPQDFLEKYVRTVEKMLDLYKKK